MVCLRKGKLHKDGVPSCGQKFRQELFPWQAKFEGKDLCSHWSKFGSWQRKYACSLKVCNQITFSPSFSLQSLSIWLVSRLHYSWSAEIPREAKRPGEKAFLCALCWSSPLCCINFSVRARSEIESQSSGNKDVRLIIADLSLKEDVILAYFPFFVKTTSNCSSAFFRCVIWWWLFGENSARSGVLMDWFATLELC